MRLQVKRHYLEAVLCAEFIDECADAILRDEQLPVVGHASGDIQDEDIVRAFVRDSQLFTGTQDERKETVFAGACGGEQIESGLRPREFLGKHHVATEAASVQL